MELFSTTIFFACFSVGKPLPLQTEYGHGRIQGAQAVKKILLSVIAAAAFCGAPALATDMPNRPAPAYKAPAPAPIYNWTGFYVGIEGGGGWADTRHTNATNGINSGTVGIDGDLFGGTYGYNWQSGPWVLGLEGDFSWSSIKKTFNDVAPGTFCTGPFQCVTDLRWLGTDRARIGYAWDRLLAYGTAGVAYGDVRGTVTNQAGITIGDNTRAGFVYGGGVEWAFAPAWSVKLEYLRTDLGNKLTYNAVGGGLPEQVSLKNLDIVRAGLNYRFGM
jgi:outer membrane immunogenic protein